MTNKIKIMLVSGVREQGKNMFAIQVNDEIFVLDAGLKYPESNAFGIDLVIPNMEFIDQYGKQIAGIFLTHGHADSIGALPYILSKVEVPVFGSELTIELAKLAVQRVNKRKYNQLFNVIDADTEIEFKNASVSFFHTTHSIPGSLGIDLHTSEGEIVYTGDFKFDPSARAGYRTDMDRLAEIEGKGVLALLSDSSNAEAAVANASEEDIATYVENVVKNAKGRVIVAAKASNFTRLQQVFDAAKNQGRKIYLTGRGVNQIVKTAIKMGYLVADDHLFVKSKDLEDLLDRQIIILETGRMGEPLQSLKKMATRRHRTVSIKENDLVFIATTPSHAVETVVAQTSDLVFKAGGRVIELGRNMNASGHATGRDLQILIQILKPKFLFPVIGEYRLLEVHKSLAVKAGMNPDNVFVGHNGDCYEYANGSFSLGQAIPSEDTMIDGSGIGDVGNIVLRDREVLSDDGIFIAVVTIDRKKKKIISEPQVTSRGFVYMKANHELLNSSVDVIKETINNNFEHKKFDWAELKQDVRNNLERFLYKQTNRRPVVLPVVMEVNQNRHRAAIKRQEQANQQGKVNEQSESK